jgi:hypothetical protein
VLHFDYQLGAATAAQPAQTQTWYAKHALSNVQMWLTEMTSPNVGGSVAIGVGRILTALLVCARHYYWWWPLHPVGYALVGSLVTTYLWPPLWISCLIKALILRYGGLGGYRRYIPFFLGLIMGEFVLGSVWALLSVVSKQRLYVFWPY